MIRCPRCNSLTKELIACEICNSIGCTRCIIKKNKKWVCENCRKEKQKPETALASLFG